MKRMKITVTGRVQGVSYRAWTKSQAVELQVKGWVRNLPDGSVEALVEGSPADLSELISRMKVGPALASVRDVQVEPDSGHEALSSFEIRR